MYRDNPFHNFEHASHVCISVLTLLSRVAPSELQSNKMLHDYTYGIAFDPLTQFTCVFSALIHDVDHTGVPNGQLIKNAAIAAMYKNKSVAEQNSLDVAWNLLMQDDFKDLSTTIYSNEIELQRFRQLAVNPVMATDIMDNARWDVAISIAKRPLSLST